MPSPTPGGGQVASVDVGSPAERAGVCAGCRIRSAAGHELRDIIDWSWYADDRAVDVEWTDPAGASHAATLVREPGSGWGVSFSHPVFDSVRTCSNRCAFCFMEQLPKGLRRALYLRDDDYRLSFLHGNFITLTNLADSDVARIVEQRLSPLYVSVHATDPAVRARLVCARDDAAVARLEELLAAGIEFHSQIVLVPRVNDEAVLDATLDWLKARSGILSVGVVPVGFTRYQTAIVQSYTEPGAAQRVLDQLALWQERLRSERGRTWVHAADEFYVNAEAPLPPSAHYDDFPQYENGIGLLRAFADECAQARRRLTAAVNHLASDTCVTLLTATMAADALARELDALGVHERVRVLAVENDFFGGDVAVTGLLTGRDLIAALRRDARSDVYLLPDVVLNPDGVTLDDRTVDEIRGVSGADVRLVSSDAAGLLAGLELVGGRPQGPTSRK